MEATKHLRDTVYMSPQLVNLTNTLRSKKKCQGGHAGGSSSPCNGAAAAAHVNDSTILPESEVVFRAVSPHGHVYWEIDPTQNYVIINNQHDDETTPLNGYNMTNREGSSRFCPEQRPLMGSPMRPPNQGSSTATTSSGGSASSNELLMRASSSMDFGGGRQSGTPNTLKSSGVASSFVRTGANRFNRSRMTLDRVRSQDDSSQSGGINPSGGGVSATAAGTGSQAVVPEQLQQQVQIRDCKPIQVSVKSSEYIEAKIRTMRKNNNNTNSSSGQMLHH